MTRAAEAAGLADLSGRELAEHLRVLRERMERQTRDIDALLDVAGSVMERLEERQSNA